MRRIWAFLTLLVSMLFAVGLISQPILEKTDLSNEFANGSVIQYEISLPEDSDYTRLDQVDVQDEIMERLDTAGIRGANLEILWPDDSVAERANTATVRISFPSQSQAELGSVRRILEGNGELSVSGEDTSAEEMMFGDDFFAANPASVEYDSQNQPYVVLKLKDSDVWQTMVDRASDSNDSSSDDSESTTYLYIWRNFNPDDGDSYDAAFSDEEGVYDATVADKLLFKVDTSSAYDADNQWIQITSDSAWDVNSARKPWSGTGDTQAWDITSARAMVDSINASNYDFDITYTFISSTEPTLGASALTWSIVAFVVAFVLLYAGLIARFGVAGVLSLVTDAVNVLVCLFIGSFLGFEFSSAALVGLAVTALLGAFINANYFSRVLGELKKGRDLVKANKEGYHKSYMVTVDTVIAAVIISFFSFLIGKGLAKIAFGFILIGSVTAFIFSNYFVKWLLYWLTTAWEKASPAWIFGLRKKEAEKKEITVVYDSTKSSTENSEVKAVANKKIDKKSKVKIGSWLGGIGVAACALVLSLGLFGGLNGEEGLFNFQGTYKDNYTLTIMTTGTSFTNREGRSQDFTDGDSFTEYIEEYVIPDYLGSFSLNGQTFDSVDAFLDGTYLDFSDVEFNMVDVTNDSGSDGSDDFNVIYATYVMPVVEGEAAEARQLAIESVIEPGMESLSNPTQNTAAATNINIAQGWENDKLQAMYVPYVTYGQMERGDRAHNDMWMAIGLACIIVFASVYAGLRFGLSAGLSEFCVSSLAVMLGVLLFSLLRLPFDSLVGFGLLGGALLVSVVSFPYYARNREILRESKAYRTASLKQREEASNYANEYSRIPVIVLGLGSLFFGVIALSFFTASSFTVTGIAFSLIGIVGSLTSYFLVPILFPVLRSKLSYHSLAERWHAFQEKRKSKKKVIVADPNEAHETVVVGLNEYRTW